VMACVKLKELNGNLMYGHSDHLDQACLKGCRARRGALIGIDELDNSNISKRSFGALRGATCTAVKLQDMRVEVGTKLSRSLYKTTVQNWVCLV
jgi:hypothetical protein